MLFLLFPSLALAACVPVSHAGHGPDKSPISPTFNFVKMDETMDMHLPSQKFDVKYWETGVIPKDCAFHGTEEGFLASDFEAFNITLGDCDEPWVACRHKDATTSVTTMANMLARMPIGMRDYLRHLIAFPHFRHKWCGVTSNANTIVADDCWQHHVLIHELAHTLDFNALTDELGLKAGETFSTSRRWTDQYVQDQHTVSQYGMTAWQEDFAESAVIGAYDLVVPAGVKSIQANWTQVEHQYSTFKQYFQKFVVSPPGTRCKNRQNNSEAINVGEGTKRSMLTLDTKKMEESRASGYTYRLPPPSGRN